MLPCLELSNCSAALACNQSSSTALRHVKGDQLCHLCLMHVVTVPLGLLRVRRWAALSHKLGGKLLRCCKIQEGSAHQGCLRAISARPAGPEASIRGLLA